MSDKKHTHVGSALIIVQDSDGNERLCLHVHLGGIWGSSDPEKCQDMWQGIRNEILDTFHQLWKEFLGGGEKDE